ncbi:uncharacterized protein STEHIDRAFT_117796 [Stereum hirsutum FP-91666 SS1]|uniref:uncharacterized protein n=1 Tax=Stereum hirsutum (strain FP-91666) TaxID=721885 RepID=UPI000440F0CC|nr:uncharacterized protein STEHIDRAFT_117796 [Stereum hirsutum FP-91666 SS1]EIM92843.1 hypothetical protein STEHIDRAFT_117796 [Stereum hirsutum FP-91666 SS1]
MPSLFSVLHSCLLGFVLVLSLICLALAGHFQAILTPSHLTRDVPFAIAVSCLGLVTMLGLIASGIWRLVSTRLELVGTGIMATLWLALAGSLAASEAKSAIVQCFASSSDSTVVGGFTTEMYQAQYRVIESFAFVIAFLLFGFTLTAFILALRQHANGTSHVWVVPIAAVDWFGTMSPSASSSPRINKLPFPTTTPSSPARRTRTRTFSRSTREPPADDTEPLGTGANVEKSHRHARNVSTPIYHQWAQRGREAISNSARNSRVYDYWRRDASPPR